LLLNAAPGAGNGSPEATDNPRRERRPRNDNRRRQPEGNDGTPQGPDEAAPAISQPDAQATGAETLAEGDHGGQPRAPRERRSRDRYGRDRRERAPRDPSTQAEDADGDAPIAPAKTEAEPMFEAPVRSSYFSQPVASESVDVAASPAAPVPEVVAAPQVRTPQAPATASAPASRGTPPVAPAASGGLPKVQAYTVSIEELNQVARNSGLEWVNSDAEKVAQVQAAIAAEPKPIHVPREIKPVEIPDDGPLVLVETRKDLRDVKLPFEAS
jgi:ribonuclease E